MWRAGAAALLILIGGSAARAQVVGALQSNSLTIGAAAVSFGPNTANPYKQSPTSYLQICNDAASGGNNIGINPTATAVIGNAGTHTLYPGGCQTFETDAIPLNAWSVIASGASTPVTIWYH